MAHDRARFATLRKSHRIYGARTKAMKSTTILRWTGGSNCKHLATPEWAAQGRAHGRWPMRSG